MTSLPTVSTADEHWLEETIEAVRFVGCCVVTDVLAPELVHDVRAALYRARDAVAAELGDDRLERAGEKGVVRLPMSFESTFFDLLGVPAILAVVDRLVSETAILHLQNGFVLPPAASAPGEVAQERFHRDFPRHLGGYVASVNTLVAIDEFTARNGGTVVVPGTHQQPAPPPQEYLTRNAVPVTCPPGSMIVFDSTLWHAAGRNDSDRDRLGVNMQFTRSFFKQQIDYVRALGDNGILSLPDRTQQLLGWYTRVVTSLDEYYQPPERRLYRAGQG